MTVDSHHRTVRDRHGHPTHSGSGNRAEQLAHRAAQPERNLTAERSLTPARPGPSDLRPADVSCDWDQAKLEEGANAPAGRSYSAESLRTHFAVADRTKYARLSVRARFSKPFSRRVARDFVFSFPKLPNQHGPRNAMENSEHQTQRTTYACSELQRAPSGDIQQAKQAIAATTTATLRFIWPARETMQPS